MSIIKSGNLSKAFDKRFRRGLSATYNLTLSLSGLQWVAVGASDTSPRDHISNLEYQIKKFNLNSFYLINMLNFNLAKSRSYRLCVFFKIASKEWKLIQNAPYPEKTVSLFNYKDELWEEYSEFTKVGQKKVFEGKLS